MARQPFNFTSKRETDYRLVRPKQPPLKPGQSFWDYVPLDDQSFEPMRIVGNGKPRSPVQITDHPMLFKKFSEIGPTLEHDEPPGYLDDSEEALRDFVRRYGRLTDEKAGDNVYLLLDEAGEMKRLLKAFERHKRRLSVQVPDLEATASLDPKTGNIDIRPRPQTLLQALWLQLIYFLSRGDGELRKCQRPGCTKTFSVGTKGGMRTDAKCCSQHCQKLFWRLNQRNRTLRGKRK